MTRSHRPILPNVMQRYNLKNLDFDTWSSAVRQQMLESLSKRRMSAHQDSSAPSDRETSDRDAK
ncbi:MAG: hypothetical protein AAGH67_02040 [Cyanobacteria bacterium P01_H01_bin.162]